jgi:glutaconate CoA-transferase subunit B
VEQLDFVTTRGDHTTLVITDLGVLEPRDGELTLTTLHPGVTAERVQEATGWELRIADDLAVSPEPTEHELAALRELVSR